MGEERRALGGLWKNFEWKRDVERRKSREERGRSGEFVVEMSGPPKRRLAGVGMNEI
jgi:hypothetical protein